MDHDNLAYDLSRYDYEKTETAAQEKTAVKVQKTIKTQPKGFLLKSLLVMLLVAFSVGALLYSQVQLTELNVSMKKEQKALDKLKSEEVRISMELDGKISLKNLENYIEKELGLVKQEDYQINYVNLSEGDEVKVVKDATPSYIKAIQNFFSGVLEYFS